MRIEIEPNRENPKPFQPYKSVLINATKNELKRKG